jgi:uncharacterized protein
MIEIYKTILDWNPWFEENQVPDDLLWIRRDIDILWYLDFKEIKILQWARRTGKSTLIYNVINNVYKHNKNLLYLNFDDEILGKYDLQEIVEKFMEKRDVEYLFLDEIQNCKNWAPYIRKMYDTKKLKQIWITGSNSSLIKKEYSSLLTGRIITLNINWLNFWEFLRFKNNEVKNIYLLSSKQLVSIKRWFKEYLDYWSFPEIALRKSNKKELLINYFDDFIYKDIVWRYNVNSTNIKNLAFYLLNNNSKLFSYRKLAKALDLNFETLSDYLNYFYEIYLFNELKKFDYSYKKQLIWAKKIYSLDTWFVNLWFAFSENKWRILENLVFIELKRRWLDVFYHKEKNECDFVIQEKWKITEAIQVSYSLNDLDTKQREVNWLIEAMIIHKLEEWIILTYEEEYEIPDYVFKIKVIPIWKWLLNKKQNKRQNKDSLLC